mmetsp:Transcript_27276/g.58374  ORF Transcript_27276/g.58374 Transcript_27276/m.58374 type:complete len:215 (-) Transcript_27276:202-846(-)
MRSIPLFLSVLVVLVHKVNCSVSQAAHKNHMRFLRFVRILTEGFSPGAGEFIHQLRAYFLVAATTAIVRRYLLVLGGGGNNGPKRLDVFRREFVFFVVVVFLRFLHQLVVHYQCLARREIHDIVFHDVVVLLPVGQLRGRFPEGILRLVLQVFIDLVQDQEILGVLEDFVHFFVDHVRSFLLCRDAVGATGIAGSCSSDVIRNGRHRLKILLLC